MTRLASVMLVLWVACGRMTQQTGSGGAAGGTTGVAGAGGSAVGGSQGQGGSVGTGGVSGTGGSSASGGSTGSTKDCDGTTVLLDRNPDLAATGPWAVGAKRTRIDGLQTEVWYPAAAGSEMGRARLAYDIRDDLPPNEAMKISDAENPTQPCNCYRDLPIDTAHGKFPLVVFVHGTAGFKTQNLDNAVHWASRGFVVMALNHPGLSIASFLTNPFAMRNLKGDVQKEIAAISMATGDLAQFANRVDVTRIGLAGHSAGGAVATMGDLPGVKVLMPISAGTVPSGDQFQSTLYVTGGNDQVINPMQVTMGYESAMARSHKRLVVISGAAHTGVTALCGIKNTQGESIIEVATRTGVLNMLFAMFAGGLFDCARNMTPDGGGTPQAEAIPMVNAATTGALEETLRCQPSAGTALSALRMRYPKIETYRQEP